MYFSDSGKIPNEITKALNCYWCRRLTTRERGTQRRPRVFLSPKNKSALLSENWNFLRVAVTRATRRKTFRVAICMRSWP